MRLRRRETIRKVLTSRKSQAPRTWPDGKEKVKSAPKSMRSTGGRWRPMVRPMIWARITPVSMAPARSIGRQACLASRPQATVTTRTMIGRATGPKTIARMIMIVVSGSERRVRSQERTGSSPAVSPSCWRTPARIAKNSTAPRIMRPTAVRYRFVPVPLAHVAFFHDELVVEDPPPAGRFPGSFLCHSRLRLCTVCGHILREEYPGSGAAGLVPRVSPAARSPVA